MRRTVWVLAGLAAVLAGLWAALPSLVAWQGEASLDEQEGRLALPGLEGPASIRRDALGVPLVEAASVEDLALATGYAMAEDRLAQMVGMTLVAQGRLSEMAGVTTLPLDVYMRTLGVSGVARAHYAALPSDLQQVLQRFADGVNAYIDGHRDRLPFGLSGYQPEPWTPHDSMNIYVLLNLGLSLNLHQELAFLAAANRVGPERAAWLFPVMPDEPLPFAEARKLVLPAQAGLGGRAEALAALDDQLEAALLPLGLAASNNWAIAPSRTAGGASILANDTHLMLDHPPMWMQIQMRAPGYNAAGVAIAGVPGVVAGYNGHVAWGMTMVMADGQDLFVERLWRGRDGNLRYKNGDAWHKLRYRGEDVRIRGRDQPVRLVIRETHRGPLLDDALQGPAINPLQPVETVRGKDDDYAMSLAWTVREPDNSLVALWRLASATSADEARAAARDIRYIHLNIVYADREHVGWQVTGRYPVRKAGTGKFPSPGWTGEYDWVGWRQVDELPALQDPPAGFIGTANDRKLPAAQAAMLSQSWFAPERGERIDALLSARRDHTRDTVIAMQADQHNVFGLKLRAALLGEPLAAQLHAAIGKLPDADRLRATEAYAVLSAWDGDMRAASATAAIFGLFEHALPREAFLDELGPEDSAAFRALAQDHLIAYSATQDHLLQRADSPFWDDVRTTGVSETKADIIARALAAAVRDAEARMGSDRAQWQWGKVHTYHWRSPATQMRPYLPWLERLLVGRLGGWLDRGPFPAGGDHNTLNVAGFEVGRSLDVKTVPAMRLVVDFSQAEPLSLVIAGGQSGNPSSPHYADGIPLYLSTQGRPQPFNDRAAMHAHFARVKTLVPAPRAPEPERQRGE